MAVARRVARSGRSCRCLRRTCMYQPWLTAPPPPPRRDALEGASAPGLYPATVSLTASANFNGICNRQYPPPTALATSSH